MAIVIIPTPLRKFTNNTSQINVGGAKVSDVVLELTTRYPNLKRYLIDPNGEVTSFINIFVDNDDIRHLKREQTEINDNTIVCIVPAIAGG